MNVLVRVLKTSWEPPSLPPREEAVRRCPPWGGEPSPDTQSASPLLLGFSAPGSVRNVYCSSPHELKHLLSHRESTQLNLLPLQEFPNVLILFFQWYCLFLHSAVTVWILRWEQVKWPASSELQYVYIFNDMLAVCSIGVNVFTHAYCICNFVVLF